MISFAFEQLLPPPPPVLQACIQKLRILNYHMSEFISLIYTLKLTLYLFYHFQ